MPVEEEINELDEPKKKVYRVDEELTVGQTLDKVRVKEINYFDGFAHLTMRT